MPTSCSALSSIELGASCSVWISWNWVVSDKLILCNKRCQGGGRRRVERTWGDLDSKGSNLYSSAQIIRVRFWVYNQPPVLEIVLVITPVNNTAGANLLLLAAAARVPVTWTPPPTSPCHPHITYIPSLSLSVRVKTTTYIVCGPRVEELSQCLSQRSATGFLGLSSFF